ncbi:MAG: hypothetical protein WCA13_05550 [Terriglobales bacterium]
MSGPPALLLEFVEVRMFYAIWLMAAGLAGWAAGKISGDDGFGTGADILF